MRALLVVNPKATTTSERTRDVIVRALRSEVDLSVASTHRRGHAVALARAAAEDGFDVVVTLGGDGTVNEAVNGLMTSAPARETLPGPAADRLPALAVVPLGSTNVFARAVGLPPQWPEATSVLLEGLRSGRFRTVGLGRADDRYFTFCAGLGLDAAVIRQVERARLRGRRSTVGLYLRSMVSEFFIGMDRRHPAIRLERAGEPVAAELATVVVQNTAPWTFIGERAINPNPEASFDLGLDVMALRQLHVPSTTRTLAQVAASRPDPRGRQLVRLHDLSEFTLSATQPQAFQLDGDYLGERLKVRFTAVREALRVVF
ncbi:diacylglycerol kinase family protein [Solwaraspora sp. WMMD792]|uniref:diacylglycerol/lipid kinase family protein n=1 Tax=Solwaraspora sp. WMMD792 TaxID=3016099 RepID=UPI002415C02B|nr:diacylglycerol kinase family protein [Solwaraspora sp. WMMD792]MDG4769267.1 diacylglycerol kinase family protein [Solwaraspora sp. WMMD792]